MAARSCKGLDLTLPAGEVHAIMGPNGSGKSTLAYVLAGKEDYEVTAGTVTWNGEDLLAMDPSERAAAGVFLAFQYPLEIPGVATMTFLRTAVNAVRKARGEAELSTPDFLRLVREKAKLLKIDPDMLKRPLNVGFSGGEKKRNEILQMALLEPSLCVLDETDSGLDIDAVRIVAEGVNALRSPERAMLVITHYQRLLNYIVPDRVHVLSEGRVARSGGPELALELEESGYAEFGGRPRPKGTAMDLPVQQFRTKAEQAYLDLFEAAEKALPGARDPFVSKLRAKAIETYGRLGLPHRRIEAWKYTDLRARLADVNPLVKADGVAIGDAELVARARPRHGRAPRLPPGGGRGRSARRSLRYRRP